MLNQHGESYSDVHTDIVDGVLVKHKANKNILYCCYQSEIEQLDGLRLAFKPVVAAEADVRPVLERRRQVVAVEGDKVAAAVCSRHLKIRWNLGPFCLCAKRCTR